MHLKIVRTGKRALGDAITSPTPAPIPDCKEFPSDWVSFSPYGPPLSIFPFQRRSRNGGGGSCGGGGGGGGGCGGCGSCGGGGGCGCGSYMDR